MKKIILLLILFITTYFYAQNTYTVDNKPGAPADYDNLQTAIDAVPAGSTLLVQGSPTSYGSATIDKQLKLIGAGYYLAQNPNTQAYQYSSTFNTVFNNGANNSSLKGITGGVSFDNVSYINVEHVIGSITISNSNNISIKYSYLNGASQFGSNYFGIHIGSNCANIIFKGNYIQNNIRTYDSGNIQGIAMINNVLSTIGSNTVIQFSEFKNNICLIATSIYFGFDLLNYPNVKYNVFRGGATDTRPIQTNQYGVDTSTLFITPSNANYSDDGKYILKSGSPAIGAGEYGIDCGIFGGGYRLSGIPNIPNIYEFTVPDTGYTNDGGISITIKVKSNN